jgi:hypothetical protein
MTAERVRGTRSAQTRPPRLTSGLKQLFKEAKALLSPAPQPKRKKRQGDGTQKGFVQAALEIGTLARALFLHHMPPAFDEGLSIHLWHENNQHDTIAENDLSAQAAQNYLFPHP